jgi:hypothetical protein
MTLRFNALSLKSKAEKASAAIVRLESKIEVS